MTIPAQNDCTGLDADEIAQAQQVTSYVIAGRDHARVRWGSEQCETTPTAVCTDCTVAVGQFHVPGCGEEQCPACRGAVVSCECWYGTPSLCRHSTGRSSSEPGSSDAAP